MTAAPAWACITGIPHSGKRWSAAPIFSETIALKMQVDRRVCQAQR